MNIVIGIAVLLTLMLSDNPFSPDDINVGYRLCGLILLTVIAPFSATVLVFLTERKPSGERSARQEFAVARVNSSIHTVIWLISSLAVVLALGWQDVVRETMQLGDWIFVDEALIVAPMLISLIASWAIFFEQSSHGIEPERRFGAMLQYVGIRCRVYLLMVLFPITLVILLKDLWPYLNMLSPAIAGLIAVLFVVAMLVAMPIMIGLMWTNRPITQAEGREPLLNLCKQHRMSVSDIRVWDTNFQIVNALVAGLFARFRVLMVTDLLLHSFPQHELKAILRHEAGHVGLRHLQTRIAFIMLPALALLAIEMDPNQSLNGYLVQIGITGGAGLVLALAFFGYVVAVTMWLSRNMEFEADLYSIGALDSHKTGTETGNEASDMADALLRFAEQNPEQLSRRSITHPSLMERIELIKKSHQDPEIAKSFRAKFGRNQFVLAFGMITVMVGLIVM